MYHPIKSVDLDDFEERKDFLLVDVLKDALKGIKTESQKCSNCGGILPELGFAFGDKEYYFTCYKIVERGKVIATTDYGKWVDSHSKHKRVVKNKEKKA